MVAIIIVIFQCLNVKGQNVENLCAGLLFLSNEPISKRIKWSYFIRGMKLAHLVINDASYPSGIHGKFVLTWKSSQNQHLKAGLIGIY